MDKILSFQRRFTSRFVPSIRSTTVLYISKAERESWLANVDRQRARSLASGAAS